MSRLTKQDANGIPIIPQENMRMAAAKLSKYEDAEENKNAEEQAQKESDFIRIECSKEEQETILKLIEDANDVCIFENNRPGCWGNCRSCVKHNICWIIKENSD